MGIIYILLSAILALLGWIGNKLVVTLQNMSKDISAIKVTIQEVSTSHDDLKDRVEKLEVKIFNL